jgi:DsbC/DsbD-like thiol-disulfide interchange protein
MPCLPVSSQTIAQLRRNQTPGSDAKVIGGAAWIFHIETDVLAINHYSPCWFHAGGSGLCHGAPYRVSLIGDAYDGTAWRTGVLIEMEEGWKTYWRMPGEAGIPPEFTWKTSVPAEVGVLFPVPGRYADASGETVGYQREVVFPVIVTAPGQSAVTLDLSLFFAVCKDICIPAQAEASIELGTGVRDPRAWRA